jgi:hypothetical protein
MATSDLLVFAELRRRQPNLQTGEPRFDAVNVRQIALGYAAGYDVTCDVEVYSFSSNLSAGCDSDPSLQTRLARLS